MQPERQHPYGEFATCKLEAEAGEGRAYLVLYDDERYTQFVHRLFERLAGRARALCIRLPLVNETNWREVSEEVLELAAKRCELRQFSLIGFRSAAAVAQNVTLRHPKSVRSLVLVDARSRPHPSLRLRLIASLERRLPLGLPFRRRQPGFDGQPFLQRLRCPTLVAITGTADHGGDEGPMLHRRIPASWLVHCPDPDALADSIAQFQEIPAKRPQKNLGRTGNNRA